MLRSRQFQHFRVGGHQLYSADGVDQRAVAHIAPVTIHRYRSANGEVTVTLHGLYRQVMAVDNVLNVSPGDTSLDSYHPARRVESRDLIHTAHVKVHRLGRRDLPPHAESSATHRNRSRPPAQPRPHLIG